LGLAAILLPQLEQPNLFATIQFPVAIENQASPQARTSTIPTYLCPSDTVNPTWTAMTRDTLGNPIAPICDVASSNYVAMFGSQEPGVDGDGLFYRNSNVRFADITDGLSQTIAAGERSHFLGFATWTGSVTGAILFDDDGDAVGRAHPEGASGMVLGHAGENATPGAADSDVNQFYSLHGPGANFLFMDGHCSFLPTSIDYPTHQAMSTRANGEIIAGTY
jgi:prepilin-type processing-associated H-X9-DG protein